MSLSRGLIIYDGEPLVPQWRLREYVDDTVVNPVLNTWYDFFPAPGTVGDCKVNYVTLNIDAGLNYEVRAILDGVTYTTAANVPGGGVDYYIYLDPNDAQLLNTNAITPFGTDEFIEFGSARIQFRRTLAGATTVNYNARYQSL